MLHALLHNVAMQGVTIEDGEPLYDDLLDQQ